MGFAATAPPPPFQWVCPFCSHAATVTSADVCQLTTKFYAASAENDEDLRGIIAIGEYIRCPNRDCREPSLSVDLYWSARPGKATSKLLQRRLLPDWSGRSFPDSVPITIRNDYAEACRIVDLSPKSAAVLARRCLQGAIRDFWDVHGLRNLREEIEAIRDRVDPLTWQAFEAVRSVGNIGAHMERDINLVVEVEPHEARLLLSLIEQLVDDWYVARSNKQLALAEIVAMAATKSDARTAFVESL